MKRKTTIVKLREFLSKQNKLLCLSYARTYVRTYAHSNITSTEIEKSGRLIMKNYYFFTVERVYLCVVVSTASSSLYDSNNLTTTAHFYYNHLCLTNCYAYRSRSSRNSSRSSSRRSSSTGSAINDSDLSL